MNQQRSPSTSIAAHGPPWLGPVRHVTEFDLHWLAVATVMLAAALLFFGWRAMVLVTVTAVSAVGAFVLMRIVAKVFRPTGPHDSSLHALVLGMLTGLALPVVKQPALVTPLLAGLLVGISANVVGRTHRLRLSPVALAVLTMWLLPMLLNPWDTAFVHRRGFDTAAGVLKPAAAVMGDVLDHPATPADRPWWSPPHDTHDAMHRPSPFQRLLTEQDTMLQHRPRMLWAFASGQLPRVGELLLGAAPGAVGGSSPLLMILLGLVMIHRRQASLLAACAAGLAGLLTLLCMPVIGDQNWSMLATHLPRLGPRAAVTFLAFWMLASPLPLIILILSPMTQPTSLWGRAAYGVIVGALGVAGAWFAGAPPAAMVGLIIAGALSRPMDALHRGAFVR